MAVVVVLVLLIAVGSAGFTGWLAGQMGREVGIWAMAGFFFGPIALLAVGLAPPAWDSGDRGRADAPEMASRQPEILPILNADAGAVPIRDDGRASDSSHGHLHD